MAIALVPFAQASPGYSLVSIFGLLLLLMFLGLGLSLVTWLAVSRKWVAAIALFVGGGAFCLMILLAVAGFFYVSVSPQPLITMRSSPQGGHLTHAMMEEVIGSEEYARPREIRVPESPPVREVTVPSTPGIPGEITIYPAEHPMADEPQEAADGDVGDPRTDPLEPYSRNLRQITQGVTTLLTSAVQSDDPDQTLRRVIPEGRPKWVEREPYWEGKVQFRAVSSGPFDNPVHCQVALEEQIRREVDDYIGEHLDYLPAKNYVHLENDFIRDHIQIAEYQEDLDISFGEMQQWHAHLQFNDRTREEIDRQWSLAQRTNRLIYLGSGFAAVLSALSIFYIGLGGQPAKVPGVTGRLRAAVILAILLVGSGAVVLLSWIPLI